MGFAWNKTFDPRDHRYHSPSHLKPDPISLYEQMSVEIGRKLQPRQRRNNYEKKESRRKCRTFTKVAFLFFQLLLLLLLLICQLPTFFIWRSSVVDSSKKRKWEKVKDQSRLQKKASNEANSSDCISCILTEENGVYYIFTCFLTHVLIWIKMSLWRG